MPQCGDYKNETQPGILTVAISLQEGQDFQDFQRFLRHVYYVARFQLELPVETLATVTRQLLPSIHASV